jgi:polygalacturonase
MKPVLALLFVLPLLTVLNASAQDTRVVKEPRIPPVCATLHAQLANQTVGTQENKLDTGRIQAAIDGCHPGMSVELRAAGGKNAFLSGPLELKSGITLLVAANTTLYASRNPRDFDVTPGSCGVVDQNGRGCKPLIRVHDASDAAVMGEGVIDGQGGAKLTGTNVSWWDLAQVAKRENTKQNCPRIIVGDHADGFTLYKITLRNSPNFHVIVYRTNGFTAWGVKIDSPRTARNTDGIDPSSSTNVSIVYSYIRAGDDNVAIKAGSAGPAAHITVAHDHFYSGHGMSIGSETNGGVNAIEVDDLTIDGADNGLRIKSDVSRGGIVRDVSYRNVCMKDVKNPVLVYPFYSNQTGTLIPDFQEITLHDVHITTPGEVTLEGFDAAHPLKLTMDGVAVDGLNPAQIRAQHAHLTFGPGRVSFIPTGDDVTLTNLPGDRKPPACEKNVFVPFPE